MRFKRALQDVDLGQVLFLVVAIKIIILALNRQLNLYIHPRYAVFTILLVTTGLLIFIISLFVFDDSHQHAHKTRWRVPGLLFIILFAFALLMIPPSTLSSRIAGVRSDSISYKQATRVVTLSTDTEKLTIEDWAALLGRPNEVQRLIGKKALISGFVIPSNDSKDTLQVARFTVTCCAIDATPLSVPVAFEGWENIAERDEWVEVRGVFIERGGVPILQASELTKIKRPDNPYAF